MIYVRGYDSVIVRRLEDIGLNCKRVERGDPMPIPEDRERQRFCKRYLYCQGQIMGEHIRDMSPIEIKQSFFINAGWIIQDIERLLDNNRYARICVIGSESGYKWSYDGAYAASKAALHRFIETKRLKYPMQQLVGIAPSCIEDSPSIQNRTEDGKKALVERVKNHPKKRWLTAMEVAQAVNYMMFIDQGYTSGVVLRMNGGEHCGDRW